MIIGTCRFDSGSSGSFLVLVPAGSPPIGAFCAKNESVLIWTLGLGDAIDDREPEISDGSERRDTNKMVK